MNRTQRNQSQKPINCVINPDSTVNMAFENNDGVRVSKLVSLNVFSELMKSDTESFELPLMPNGIRKWKQSGDYTVIAIEHPAQVVDRFKFYGSTVSVPTPNSVWLHLLKARPGGETYEIIKSHVFSLAMPLLSETQQMYKWPFPNYSTTYSPGICWGNDNAYANMARDCNPRNLSSLFSMYFSARFNDDLGFDFNVPDGGDTSGDTGNSRLDFLSKQDTFDSSWFQTESFTFREAVDNLLGNRRR